MQPAEPRANRLDERPRTWYVNLGKAWQEINPAMVKRSLLWGKVPCPLRHFLDLGLQSFSANPMGLKELSAIKLSE